MGTHLFHYFLPSFLGNKKENRSPRGRESDHYLMGFSLWWKFLKHNIERTKNNLWSECHLSHLRVAQSTLKPSKPDNSWPASMTHGLGGSDLGLPLSKSWKVVFTKGCKTRSFSQKAPGDAWGLLWIVPASQIDHCVLTEYWLFARLRARHFGRCAINTRSSSIKATSPWVTKWELSQKANDVS